MSSPKYRTIKIYSRFHSLTIENSTSRSCNSSTTDSLHSNNPLNIFNSVSHRLPFIFFHGVQLCYSNLSVSIVSAPPFFHLFWYLFGYCSSGFTHLLQQILIFQHSWSFFSSVALPEMISNINSHFSVYNTVYPLVGS